MDYKEELSEVVGRHGAGMRADLEEVQRSLSRARRDVETLERRSALLQGLLILSDPDGQQPQPVSGTLHEAMAEVLRSSPNGMMRAGDLAAEINRLRLYRMRDGRPVEPQQIHARVGNYGHLFTKEGIYIKLVQ